MNGRVRFPSKYTRGSRGSGRRSPRGGLSWRTVRDVPVLNERRWVSSTSLRGSEWRTVEESSPHSHETSSSLSSSSSPVHGHDEIKKDEQRLKDNYAIQRRQRLVLHRRYGGYVSPSRILSSRLRSSVSSDGRRLTTTRTQDDGTVTSAMLSVLAPMERRLDVVLWRSGLTVTPSMAHQQCTHGHVRVRLPGATEFFVVKHPGYARPVGSVVQLDPKRWATRSRRVTNHWTSRSTLGTGESSEGEGASSSVPRRTIPSYLHTDFRTGTVVFSRLPLNGEVRVPHGASLSLSSMRR